MLKDGSYVYHEMAPATRRGTISNGAVHNGRMRFIFHLDKRFSDAALFGDGVYFYDYELVECARPDDAEVAIINKLAAAGG
jgi:hypothetical protein